MSDRSDPVALSEFAWHDNAIHGLHLGLGNPDAGDWRSDLVLDIDHIVAWDCNATAGARLRVAPATLTFRDVCDLSIAVDCGDSGGQVALHELSIDRITREPIADQRVCLDRPYFRWTVALNWPKGGTIRFAASGFTLTLRGEPVATDSPRLAPSMRASSA